MGVAVSTATVSATWVLVTAVVATARGDVSIAVVTAAWGVDDIEGAMSCRSMQTHKKCFTDLLGATNQ